MKNYTRKSVFPMFVTLLTMIPNLISADPPADHNLFVGVNLSVPHNEVYYPVAGISKQKLVLDIEGERITQPIFECGNIKFTKISKVSPNFIEVSDVVCKSDYSMEADPAMRAARTHIVLANAAAQATAVQNVAIRNQQEIQGQINAGAGPGGFNAAASQAMNNASSSNLSSILSSVNQALSDSMNSMSVLPGVIKQGDLEDNGHDILRLEFSAKALKDIPDPTMFIILELKENAQSEDTKIWFQFADLDSISTEGDKYSFMTPAFPDGMFIDSYELYFFSEGTEIASTLSEKRVSIPRQDAKSYLNFQYIDEHERETLPASLVWKTMSLEDFGHSKTALLETRIKLDIDENGNVTAVRVPKKVSGQINEDVLQSIRALMFYPALQNGNPVESQLKIQLKDLIL